MAGQRPHRGHPRHSSPLPAWTGEGLRSRSTSRYPTGRPGEKSTSRYVRRSSRGPTSTCGGGMDAMGSTASTSVLRAVLLLDRRRARRKLDRMQNETGAMVQRTPTFRRPGDRADAGCLAAVRGDRDCVRRVNFRGWKQHENLGLDSTTAVPPFCARPRTSDVAVWLHPTAHHGERLQNTLRTVGNPLDTTVAINRIIHGGVLEEHPALKPSWCPAAASCRSLSRSTQSTSSAQGRHHITRAEHLPAGLRRLTGVRLGHLESSSSRGGRPRDHRHRYQFTWVLRPARSERGGARGERGGQELIRSADHSNAKSTADGYGLPPGRTPRRRGGRQNRSDGGSDREGGQHVDFHMAAS